MKIAHIVTLVTSGWYTVIDCCTIAEWKWCKFKITMTTARTLYFVIQASSVKTVKRKNCHHSDLLHIQYMSNTIKKKWNYIQPELLIDNICLLSSNLTKLQCCGEVVSMQHPINTFSMGSICLIKDFRLQYPPSPIYAPLSINKVSGTSSMTASLVDKKRESKQTTLLLKTQNRSWHDSHSALSRWHTCKETCAHSWHGDHVTEVTLAVSTINCLSEKQPELTGLQQSTGLHLPLCHCSSENRFYHACILHSQTEARLCRKNRKFNHCWTVFNTEHFLCSNKVHYP